MIKLIKNWYNTKKIQAQLKAELYGTMESIIRKKDNIKELIKNTYQVLKNTPDEEFQQKLIEQIALLVHETNKKKDTNTAEMIINIMKQQTDKN